VALNGVGRIRTNVDRERIVYEPGASERRANPVADVVAYRRGERSVFVLGVTDGRRWSLPIETRRCDELVETLQRAGASM
jgi:hypothetical protein